MSNLFKQYNTVIPEQNVRMIDYNAAVEQKLEKLARLQKAAKGADENGFTGLGSVVQEVKLEDPQEVLQKAKDEAKEMRNQAREEASALIGNAKKRSEEILAEAREEGHKKGYEEGLLQIKDELETEYSQKNEALERQSQKLRADYEREMRELEPKLLDVILTVVEKVFHIQFQDKRDMLLYLIGNAIADIEGCREFRIRVGDDQKAFLESRRDEILDRVGHDMSLEIVSDLSLSGNQCVIETDTGIFDCSMDVQFKNLIKDLRALSS